MTDQKQMNTVDSMLPIPHAVNQRQRAVVWATYYRLYLFGSDLS